MNIPNELTINGEVYVRQTTAKEPEGKPWPQKGDVVWFQYANGRIGSRMYDDDHIDNSYLRQGRVHRTEAEAIRANEVEAANAAIRRWRDENAPFVPDWTDEMKEKVYGLYNHQKLVWTADFWSLTEIPNTVYFATESDLTRCQSELPDAWAALVGVK